MIYPFLWQCIVGFIDPSSSESPGWPLRNLLYLITYTFKVSNIKVLCYRRNDSFILNVNLPAQSSYTGNIYIYIYIRVYQKLLIQGRNKICGVGT